MNKALANIFIDGLILLAASTLLALLMIGFNKLLDKNLDGNPLVSAIIKQSESDEKDLSKTIASIDKQPELVNFQDHHKATALMLICYVNYDKVETMFKSDTDRLPYVNLLIEKGADIHIRDKDGWTAVCWASWSGVPSITKRLAELGADINIRDKEGNTPLMMAAMRGNHEVVTYLLEHGADINATCQNGMTALDYARREWERISKNSFMQYTIMPLDFKGTMAANKKEHTERYAKTVALLSSEHGQELASQG